MNSNSTNSSQSKANDNAWAENLWNVCGTFLKAFYLIGRELVFGLIHRPQALLICGSVSVILYCAIHAGWDYWLLYKFDWTAFYPRNHTLFKIYQWVVGTSPLWMWALIQNGKRQSMERKLEGIFLSAGMNNRLGHTPRYCSDMQLEEGVRRLRIKRSHYSLKDIQNAKPSIEAGLRVYVDEITENRERGTVDIHYSKTPMPEFHKLPGPFAKENEFKIGVTRRRQVFGNLAYCPHLLIAGQTGGGKSTFLRQFITTLYKGNDRMDFTLIDLKGGLEFQTFENLPRVKVVPSLEEAKAALKVLESKIQNRMDHLKKLGLNHIDAKTKDGTMTGLNRLLVVIDEAAEIFLPGNTYGVDHLAAIRVILNKIARQGRAVGIHLVVATQRPDVKALDPQVKANLTGILCFQMPNNTASITVLDSGRASDLPSIPGRAIWKFGAQMTEVQTPYFSEEDAQSFLERHRIKVSPSHKKQNNSSANESKPFEIVA